MTDKEAMKQALKALKRMERYGNVFLHKRHEQSPYEQICEAITALEDALAQPEQEPVAWAALIDENQRLRVELKFNTSPAQPAPVRKCRSCNGAGEVSTGIWESPTSICKPCFGTGQITTPPAQPAPVQEPVAFKIYKPTPPRHAIPNVQDAELPWVYDQDPSSGNVASMWVTPVQTLRSKS